MKDRATGSQSLDRTGNLHQSRVDRVVFRQPIHVGELVSFLASVNHVGKSSMEIGIKVLAENIRTQQMRHVNSCFFTMVAVDENGRKVSVSPWQPCTDDQIRRSAQARLRRRLRDKLQDRLATADGEE